MTWSQFPAPQTPGASMESEVWLETWASGGYLGGPGMEQVRMRETHLPLPLSLAEPLLCSSQGPLGVAVQGAHLGSSR